MGTGIKILPSSGYRLRLDCDLCGSESLFVVKTLPYNMAVYPDAREASHLGLLFVVARR